LTDIRSLPMTSRQFTSLFSNIAKEHGWIAVDGGWTYPRQSADECVTAVSLQKASHEAKWYVNIGVHVDGVYGRALDCDAQVSKTQPHVFRREPKDLQASCDLTTGANSEERTNGLRTLFDFLDMFAGKARTRRGLLELEQEGMVCFVPTVRREIERLVS